MLMLPFENCMFFVQLKDTPKNPKEYQWIQNIPAKDDGN
jgi:hypothetical protein